jgi:G:T-mismatch repair DNA endonuclease (very short patch repair protein)
MKLCSIEGCENNHLAKGFCNKHYLRNKTYGDPLHVVVRICSVTGCNKKHKGQGYCVNHLIHYRNYGDPLAYADPEETARKKSASLKGKTPWNKGKTGVFSEKTRRGWSKKRKGRIPHNKGKPHSEETKKKISIAGKGRIVSEATKKKMSERIISAETRAKQNTPEAKERKREVLRRIRHNQTSPTKPESKIMEVLTGGGIKYKFNTHVDYLTLQGEYRKKEIDFLIKPKKIIEFNGYRHFDNRNFKPDDMVTHHNKRKKCQDIWNEEDTVLNQIKKGGHRILIIWQIDLEKDTENITKKILKFAKS